MKLLMNACALAALAFSASGQASAQIEVKPAPIHAVPADPDEDRAPAAANRPVQDAARGRADSAVAAITQAPPTSKSLLSPQEAAFFVALGHRLTDAAAAYQAYVRAASAIDAGFTNARSVSSALAVAVGYNAEQLQEGAIAYAAVLALRNQDFVDGVRAQAGDRALSDRLIADPSAVFAIRGAQDAAQDVSGVMQAQADAMKSAGRAISSAAYSVQHQSWSRDPVAEPDKVLTQAKASALKLASADEASERRLLDSIGAATNPAGAATTRSEEITRGLALAAVAVLGGAGDAQESRFDPLLRDLRNADCLQMAKMNLNQCLAVAGPQYEDVFCMGRHAVGETAQCLVAAVGDDPLQGARTAELDGYGEERAEAYADPRRGN